MATWTMTNAMANRVMKRIALTEGVTNWRTLVDAIQQENPGTDVTVRLMANEWLIWARDESDRTARIAATIGASAMHALLDLRADTRSLSNAMTALFRNADCEPYIEED